MKLGLYLGVTRKTAVLSDPLPQAAAPTFGTDGGTFNNATTTTMATTTPGGVIYYTTDGSVPDETKTLYSGGNVNVTATGELRAATFADGYRKSPIKSATFTFVCATPTFGTNGGSSNNDMSTTITSSTTGAAISYTIPNTSVQVTTNGATVTVNRSGQVLAVATKAGYSDSSVATSNAFNLTVGAITPTVSTGTYNNDFAATFSVATTTSPTKEYSYDNINWSAYGSGPTITGTTPYYMRATKTGYTSSTANVTYTMKVATPTFGTNGGSSNNDMSTTITSSTTGAAISYSGAAAGSGSTTNGGTVSVTASGTITAYGTKAGYTNSDNAVSSSFTLTVGAITPSQATGTYNADFTLTASVSTTTGSTLYYSYDNSSFSTLGAGVTIDRTRTVYLEARKTGYTTSTANRTYTMQVATPTFSPSTGNYSSTQNVTVSTTTTGANGYYTVGSSPADPTTGSTPITGTIGISTTQVLKALMVRANWTNSAIGSATYTFDYTPTNASALAYCNAVDATGGTPLSPGRKILFDNWYISGTNNSWLSLVKDFALFMHGNAAKNLIKMVNSSSTTGAFANSPTHSSNYTVMNGTNNSYTHNNPFSNTTVNAVGGGCFLGSSYTYTSGTREIWGAYSTANTGILCLEPSSTQVTFFFGAAGTNRLAYSSGGVQGRGMWHGNRTSQSNAKLFYHDTSSLATLVTATGMGASNLPTVAPMVGARGDDGVASWHVPCNISASWVTSGMNDTNVTNFMNATNTLITGLESTP